MAIPCIEYSDTRHNPMWRKRFARDAFGFAAQRLQTATEAATEFWPEMAERAQAVQELALQLSKDMTASIEAEEAASEEKAQ